MKLSEIYPVLSELPAEHPSLADESDSDSDIPEDYINLDSSNHNTVDNDQSNASANHHSLPLIDSVDINNDISTNDSTNYADTSHEDNQVDSGPSHESVISEDLDSTIAYDLDEALPSDIDPDARRSSRKSTKPSWTRSGDYVMSCGKKR